MNGYFITLEGGEGAGKSTAVQFLAKYLHENSIKFILTREPGGTEIAEKIRKIILDHHLELMHPDTELLLYFAGRAQHLNQVIIPALKCGQWVICDRFTDATYAYQGAGRRLSQEKIAVLENLVQDTLHPDYTLLFDINVDRGFSRIKNNRALDRLEIENEEFYERVRRCYLDRVQKEPKRFRIIDANRSPEEVVDQVRKVLEKIIS
ncbi:Thymidylate kinase [Gammaproteobacteria bacterium]